jgi:hypothetical protein
VRRVRLQINGGQFWIYVNDNGELDLGRYHDLQIQRSSRLNLNLTIGGAEVPIALTIDNDTVEEL